MAYFTAVIASSEAPISSLSALLEPLPCTRRKIVSISRVFITIAVSVLIENSLSLLLRVLAEEYILDRVNVVSALAADNLNYFVRIRQAVK